MPDKPPPASGKAAIGVTALIGAAVIAVQPFTASHEGTIYRAYPDPGTRGAPWTICKGHTGPDVHSGMTATPAQCNAWYQQDMTAKMVIILRMTPQMAEKPSALQAAGDFAFNAGEGWWAKSPMAAAFAKRQWRAGCEAFTGYLTLYKAPKVVAGRNCRTNAKGVLYCELPGLVTRRQNESALCLKGLAA